MAEEQAKRRKYLAVVERTIQDEIEIDVDIVGELSTSEIEDRIEDMAKKSVGFDPLDQATRIKTRMIVLDLIEER